MRRALIGSVLVIALLACFVTPILAVTPPPEPLPRSGGCTVYANGQLYWYLGRSATGITDSAGKFYNLDYASPGVSIFDPAAGTWSGAKWDGTGPMGMDQDANGKCEWNNDPGWMGSWTQTNHGFAYDDDADGVDEIFSVGGFPMAGRSCPIFRYDPNSGPRGSWTLKGDFTSLFDQFRRGAVGLYGSKVYIASGGGSGAKFGSFDLGTGVVTQYGDGPGSDYNGHVVLDGKFYIVGGSADSGTSVWECDLTGETPAWSNNGGPVATLPTGVRSAQVVTYNGTIYVLGGLTATGATNIIQQFTPSGAFPYAVTVRTETLPAPMYSQGAAVNPATGTLYVGGGGRAGTDPARPSSLAATWWTCNLGSATLAFTAIANDPSYFACEDWGEGTITGRVTLGGVGLPHAIVGLKRYYDGSSPTANSWRRVMTDAGGNFGFMLSNDELLSFQPITLAAWQEGFAPTDDLTVPEIAENGKLDLGDIPITTVAGKDLAVSTGSQSYRSSIEPEYFEAPRAFTNSLPFCDLFSGYNGDWGRSGDRWSSQWDQSAPNDQHWLGVDLNNGAAFDWTPYIVNGVSLVWDYAYAGSYRVDVCDGVDVNAGGQVDATSLLGDSAANSLMNPELDPYSGLSWTTVYETAGNMEPWWQRWYAGWDPIRFEPVNARAVRVVMQSYARWNPGEGMYSIWRMMVHSATEYQQQVLCGFVKDSAGNKITEAHVRLSGQSDYKRDLFTDATGHYRYVSEPGVRQLTADALGYKNSDLVLTVAGSASPVNSDIVLAARPGETNRVSNGNFESGFGWTGREDDPQGESIYGASSAFNHTTGGAWAGTWDMQACTVDKNADIMSAKFPVVSDGSKAYTMYYWRAGSGNDSGGNSYQGIRWFAADGTTQVADSGYGYYGWNSGGSWWRTSPNYMYRAVPPAGAAYGAAYCGSWQWASNPSIQAVDDVVIDEADVTMLRDVATIADGTMIVLGARQQITVMPGGGAPDGTAYVETKDRTLGCRLDLSALDGIWVGTGDTVSMIAEVKVSPQGEHYLRPTSLDWNEDRRPIDALGMNNRFAGTDLVKGLYVKLWGEVKETSDSYFTISDGGGAPIKVLCGKDRVLVPMPNVGQFVRVRGVMGTDPTKVELIMNGEAVDWVDGASEFQPFSIPGPVNAFRDYVVAGPFTDAGHVTNEYDDVKWLLDNDFIAAATGGASTESTIEPNVGDALGTLSWVRYNGAEEMVHLNYQFGTNDHSVFYAAAYIWSPIAQDIDLVMGSDDMLALWLNGVQVLYDDGWRGVGYGSMHTGDGPDHNLPYKRLEAGWNTLLCKIANGGGDYGILTQIAIPGTYTGEGWGNSTPVEGLGYSAFKPY